jgi:hypothetical protein
MRRTRRHRTEEPVEEAVPPVPEPTKALRADSTSGQERRLRTRADFDNYKRRIARDRDAAGGGLDGMRRRLGSVLDAEGVKIGRGYLWNGEFLRRPRARLAD